MCNMKVKDNACQHSEWNDTCIKLKMAYKIANELSIKGSNLEMANHQSVKSSKETLHN